MELLKSADSYEEGDSAVSIAESIVKNKYNFICLDCLDHKVKNHQGSEWLS